MSVAPDQRPPRAPLWLCLLPFLAGVLVHLGALRSSLVLEKEPLVDRLQEIPSLRPSALFFEDYIRPNRVDRGYRPLTLATWLLSEAQGAPPAASLAINILEHGAVAVAVFLLLQRLTGSSAGALLGSLCFAVLSVHTEAISRLEGRAEISGALLALAAWLVALRNAPDRPNPGVESLPLAAAAGGLTLAALLAKENDALLLSLAVIVSTRLLGRKVPWISVAGMGSAAIGYLAFRSVVLEDRSGYATLLMNPLRDAGWLEQLADVPRHLGFYAVQSLFPWKLSAEYSWANQPAGVASAALTIVGLAGIALALACFTKSLREKVPLLAVGTITFVALCLPAALVLTPQKYAFAERNAYLPSVGLMIVLVGAFLAYFRARWRLALVAGVLVLLAFSARTVARNEDWVSGDAVRLVPAKGSPGWSSTLLSAYSALEPQVKGVLEQRELRAFMGKEAERALQVVPDDGWAHAILGQNLLAQGQHAKALEELNKAIAWLESRQPPAIEPRAYQLRGEAFVALDRVAEAYADFDKYIRVTEGLRQTPDAQAYSRRGLCLAKSGALDAALLSFDKAIALRADLAEIWNNRGFTKFKLNDLQGAINDYQEALNVCFRNNILTSESGDSVHAFLLRISDVYRTWGERLAAAGDTTGARAASVQSQEFKSKADTLVPRPPGKGAP